MESTWHYKDEKTGQRLGPVDREELARLIANGRLEPASLVWKPQMPDWVEASSTDLADLFSDRPPPLPGKAISRWALFTVALLPEWGTVLQSIISSQFPNPRAAFDNLAWVAVFIAGNVLFGWLDGKYLERAGLRVKGALVMSALIIPVYIFLSCRTYHRRATVATWLAYSPLIIWILAVLLAANQQAFFFTT